VLNVRIFHVASWLAFAPAEAENRCERSAHADLATDIFADAQELAYEAATPQAHAAAGQKFAEAARAIPVEELPWKQGTKYVGLAHDAFLKAFTDETASLAERREWLSADRTLLEEYLAAVAEAKGREDPCLGDSSVAETNLQVVMVVAPRLEETSPEGEPETVPSDPAEDPGATTPIEPKPDPDTDKPKAPKNGRGLLIGAGVSGAIGIAGFVVMGVGLATASKAASDLQDSPPDERDEVFPAGERGNLMSAVGGAIGGVGFAVGTGLLVGGLVRRNRHPQLGLSPSLQWTGREARFTLTGKF